MQWHETTDEFKFSRGSPVAGWVFTAALLGCLLYFLGPLLHGAWIDGIEQALKQATMGGICAVTAVGGLLVLTVVAAVNGIFACCSIVFDKSSGQVTRDWRLGLLRDHETHAFADVAAVAYVATNTGDNDAPSYSYRLKCYFKDEKTYELTISSDQQAVIELVQRLRSFLSLPADGTMHYEAQHLAEKMGEARQRFAALAEQSTLGPMSGMLANLLTRQMGQLQTMLAGTVPVPVNPDASMDEMLARLGAEPMNATLYLEVAEILRKRQQHAEAAAVLERAVAIMAKAAAARDQENPRRPAVHPLDD